MASMTSETPSARPYRSHKVPACDFCRKRRSRCTQELADQPCLLCRMHGATCSRAPAACPRTIDEHRPTPIAKRRRISKDIPDQRASSAPLPPETPGPSRHSPPGDRHAPTPTPEFTQNNNVSSQSRHIVGPAMARDAQVLERCMSSIYNTAVSYARPNPYSVYSDDTRNPVVYMKVPRQRGAVPSGNGTAGWKQFEAMEKVVEPLGPELCAVFVSSLDSLGVHSLIMTVATSTTSTPRSPSSTKRRFWKHTSRMASRTPSPVKSMLSR
jgi:hypothetical protein